MDLSVGMRVRVDGLPGTVQDVAPVNGRYFVTWLGEPELLNPDPATPPSDAAATAVIVDGDSWREGWFAPDDPRLSV